MTARPAPPDLASVAWLEQLLPPGYSIAHSRHRWYYRRWDSWITNSGPRMSWRDVDSDTSLASLLARLGEH